MSNAMLLEEVFQQGHATPEPFSPAELAVALHQLRERLLEDTWTAVDEAAARCIGLAVGTLESRFTGTVPRSPLTVDIYRGWLAALLGAVARSEDASTRLAELQQALLDAGAGPGDEIVQTVEALSSGSLDPLEHFAVTAPAAPRAQEDADLDIAVLMRGLLGRTHAAFNLAWPHEPFLPGASLDHRESAIESIAERFAAELDGLLFALYQDCGQGVTPSGAISHCARIRHFAMGEMPRLARALAAGRRSYDLRIESGQGTAAERIGRICINGGFSLREALAAAVAANRLALTVATSRPDESVAETVSSASPLPFATQLPNGVNHQIHQLAGLEDGAFVEIDGRLLAGSASMDAESRMIGRIELQDPSSGAEVTALGFFINPPNAGLTVGAHVRLSGAYRPSAHLNGGEPAIIIDRLPFAQLATQQWRLAFLRLGFPWFPVYRNGHNLFWSMGPHEIVEPLDSTRAGAAELIFLDHGPAQEGSEELT